MYSLCSAESVKSSTESVKSTPEKETTNPKPEENSENELFGITTLQNIFRSVSSIDSNQNKSVESTKSLVRQTASVSSCCTSHENCRIKVVKSHCRDLNSSGVNSAKLVENAKSLAAVLHSSLPTDKVTHSSVVSGFGDSNVGTPV